MSKKKVKKKSKPVKLSKQKEYIQILIDFTVRNITNDGSDLDALFIGQRDKLLKEFEESK